jgi:predicted nucleic acid-binding protein
MIIVPDASVAIKWYVNEVYTTSAEKLLDGVYELHAPELILPEFGNIVWKKATRGELTSAEGAQIVSTFVSQNIEMHSHKSTLNAAFAGAEGTGQTVYDWSYLALAVSLSCPFVTADERFFNALTHTKLSKNLIWIGDL